MNVAFCDNNIVVCHEHKEHIFEIAKKNSLKVSLLEYSSGNELLKKYKETSCKMDLLYIDVHLQDIEGDIVTSELRNLGYTNDIVFHTASTEIYHFKRAFANDALDYIIKNDTSDEEFEKIFLKAVQKFKEREKDYITLSFAGETINIMIEDIYYFEYKNHKIIVHYGNKQTFVFWDTLRRMENKLDFHGFLRIHNGYLANMNNIQAIKRGEVVMKNGDRLAVNKRNTTKIKSEYYEYMGIDDLRQ